MPSINTELGEKALSKMKEEMDWKPLKERCHRHYRGWSKRHVERILTEYQRFLALKVATRDHFDTLIMPPQLIEAMWRQHVLGTQEYTIGCHFLLEDSSNVLHYNPDNVTTLPPDIRSKRIELTKASLCMMFHSTMYPLDQEAKAIWDFESGNSRERSDRGTPILEDSYDSLTEEATKSAMPDHGMAPLQPIRNKPNIGTSSSSAQVLPIIAPYNLQRRQRQPEQHQLQQHSQVQPQMASTPTAMQQEMLPAQNHNQKLSVYIYREGKIFKLHICPSDSVYGIKTQVQRREGIPANQQYLEFDGEEMNDHRAVSSYAIGNNAAILLSQMQEQQPVERAFQEILLDPSQDMFSEEESYDDDRRHPGEQQHRDFLIHEQQLQQEYYRQQQQHYDEERPRSKSPRRRRSSRPKTRQVSDGEQQILKHERSSSKQRLRQMEYDRQQHEERNRYYMREQRQQLHTPQEPYLDDEEEPEYVRDMSAGGQRPIKCFSDESTQLQEDPKRSRSRSRPATPRQRHKEPIEVIDTDEEYDNESLAYDARKLHEQQRPSSRSRRQQTHTVEQQGQQEREDEGYGTTSQASPEQQDRQEAAVTPPASPAPRKRAPLPFQVYVNTIMGFTITFTANAYDPIGHIKKLIEVQESVPARQQLLIHEGVQLEDSKRLMDYAPSKATSLHVLLRLRGGSNHSSVKSKPTTAATAGTVPATTRRPPVNRKNKKNKLVIVQPTPSQLSSPSTISHRR